MSIEAAERLKREWTDKYVKVRLGVPELRRFAHLTGRVKTVNMNCRALVQFDGPEDISWYDIDPSFLVPVEKPTEGKPAAAKPAAAHPPAAPKPAAVKPAALSPLELARQQGASGGATATPAAPPVPAAKLSPLELARQQGAGPTAATPAAPPATPAAPAPVSDTRPPGKPDDLKLVEGIGPQIEKILKENGIKTWLELSQTSVDRLRELLKAAGSRYRLANPITWPRQAELAAAGQWEELRAWQDRLDKGVPPTEG